MTELETADLSLEPKHMEPPDDSIPVHLIKIPEGRGRKDFKGVIDLRAFTTYPFGFDLSHA